MKVYVFGAYRDFKCMAGKCQATCCSGWKIVVDKKSYDRFKNLENRKLRKDILSNIVSDNDNVLVFKNRANRNCAMLDDDGLCRIQRNSDEKALCNTCRKYPRLSFKDKDITLLSMAASCPVVIDYLCRENSKGVWYDMAYDKKMYPIISYNIPELSDELQKFNALLDKVKKKYFEKSERLCELFYNFADLAVDIILSCNDCIYLDGSFDIYEEQMDEMIFQEKYDRFSNLYKEKLLIFEKNYVEYRILTRRYEKIKENISERLYQIVGEIIMNKVIMFSLSQRSCRSFESDIVQSVHWVYKTAVHGEISASKMHKKIMGILAQ